MADVSDVNTKFLCWHENLMQFLLFIQIYLPSLAIILIEYSEDWKFKAWQVICKAADTLTVTQIWRMNQAHS